MGSFAGARDEIFYGSFVCLKVVAGEEAAVDGLIDGLQPEGGKLGPAAEGVAADGYSVAGGGDFFLTVKWEVVAVFGDQHLGDEAGCGGESVLKAWWKICYEGRGVAVVGADEDRPYQPMDEDFGGLVVEPVAVFFADAPPICGAVLDGCGEECFLDDGKVLGEPWATWFES